MEDKRRSHRVATAIPTRGFRVTCAGSLGGAFVGTVRNVSTGGVLLESYERLYPTSRVYLEFDFDGLELAVDGVVMRHVEHEALRRTYGVSFQGLASEERIELAKRIFRRASVDANGGSANASAVSGDANGASGGASAPTEESNDTLAGDTEATAESETPSDASSVVADDDGTSAEASGASTEDSDAPTEDVDDPGETIAPSAVADETDVEEQQPQAA